MSILEKLVQLWDEHFDVPAFNPLRIIYKGNGMAIGYFKA
jgi:hypothetical protein